MAEPIVATYAQEGDDWTVAVFGHGTVLTARAPGIIAARDRADQLADQLTDELTDELGSTTRRATMVHLLNGSALEFTSVYMTARLARPEPAPIDEPPAPPAAPKKPQTKSTRRPNGKFTTDIGDALTAAKPARRAVDLGPEPKSTARPAEVVRAEVGASGA